MLDFIEAEHLYSFQRGKLENVSIDDRIEYEELAAWYEYEAGMRRAFAERHAYCQIQWAKKWHTQSWYPDFKARE